MAIVYQTTTVDPEGGIEAVIQELLLMPVPQRFPDQAAASNLFTHAGCDGELFKLTRGGSILPRGRLASLVAQDFIRDGWFFVGVPGKIGHGIEPTDVTRMLTDFAFVVDVLDGRFLTFRTIDLGLATLARTIIPDAGEIEQCEIGEVRLAY